MTEMILAGVLGLAAAAVLVWLVVEAQRYSREMSWREYLRALSVYMEDGDH